MKYCRRVRALSRKRITAWLGCPLLLAAGCAGHAPHAPSAPGPCEIVTNGTPAPKASATSASGPEVATGYRRDMTAVRTAHYAVATANPLATQAACQVLRDGGSAADALVTAQTVLGLVEPQSSGIGGGGFLIYYDAASGSLQTYDGREVAPAAATQNYLRWIDGANHASPQPDSQGSGRSIGVPGILRLLELVHNNTAGPSGATCSTPRSHWPTTGSPSAPGWRPRLPMARRTCAPTRWPPTIFSTRMAAARAPALG
jgi:gamma-glutamyltranspeptidase/glutathione hydrolase